MKKDTNLLIRINSELKSDVTTICKNNNVTLSELITAYLETTVIHKKIPLNVLGRINYHKAKENNILNLAYIKKSLEEIFEKYGNNQVKKAYLFGSYARGEATTESDVDIRIEVGDKMSLIDYSNIRLALIQKLGKEVDLISQDPQKLDSFFYDEIKKEEICLYEQKRPTIN